LIHAISFTPLLHPFLRLEACTPNPVVNPDRDRNGASGGRAWCRALAG
jgi:hypothetical protein